MSSTIAEIHNILSQHKFNMSSELPLQEQMAAVFSKAGIVYQKEVILSPHDRIDFMIGDIGIEVKVKGSPSMIYQQCRRYCHFDQVKELLLVTARAMGLPPETEGKPCYLLNLGRSWL